MKPTFEDLSLELAKRHVRSSYQRVKLLEYLINNPHHPTADQIYTGLQKEIPTLSKSTVYNTLNAFSEAQLIKTLTIEDNEIRYDIVTDTHGHFKCETCGTIFNFKININQLTSDDLNTFKITDQQIFFKGICPKCLKKLKNGG